MTCPICGKDGAVPGGFCEECEQLRLDSLQDEETKEERDARNEKEDRSRMYKDSALSAESRKPQCPR